jgi:hypothetical protein
MHKRALALAIVLLGMAAEPTGKAFFYEQISTRLIAPSSGTLAAH